MEYEEIWRDIRGYEGAYQVSNLGRVRSLDRTITYNNHGTLTTMHVTGKILKQDIDEDGYCRINIRYNHKDKRFGVHRLVAAAFIENPQSLPQVNHKDCNKSNNSVSNLEWCDAKYNNLHAAANGRRPHSIYKNREAVKNRLSTPVQCIETGEVFYSMIEAERRMHLGSTSVYFSIRNNKPTKQGYTFKKL